MAENGRLPASSLRPIAGEGQLAAAAAAAWNALAQRVYRETGVKIASNGSLSTYRTYQQQVYMKGVYGSNAATPGTSNHGWGLAVDTDDHEIVNRYGAPYGWQKAWSDASWEPWHFKYAPGHFNGKDPGPTYGPKHPPWWKTVGHKIKAARKRRLAKKARREATENPERRSVLHKAIGKLTRLIERLTKRREKAK